MRPSARLFHVPSPDSVTALSCLGESDNRARRMRRRGGSLFCSGRKQPHRPRGTTDISPPFVPPPQPRLPSVPFGQHLTANLPPPFAIAYCQWSEDAICHSSTSGLTAHNPLPDGYLLSRLRCGSTLLSWFAHLTTSVAFLCFLYFASRVSTCTFVITPLWFHVYTFTHCGCSAYWSGFFSRLGPWALPLLHPHLTGDREIVFRRRWDHQVTGGVSTAGTGCKHPVVHTRSAMIGHGFGGWVKKNRY